MPDPPTPTRRTGDVTTHPPPRTGLFRAAAGVFVLALAVRLLSLNQLADTHATAFLTGDGEVYDRWARQLAQGDWLGKDVFYQAPLYPYFIAVIYRVFGASVGALRLTQVVLGSAACVILLLATRRFFGSIRAGVIAGLALALYAPAVFSDMIVQKSSLDVFFTCLLLAFASHLNTAPTTRRRAAWSALMGLTLACLSLTRENALALIPVAAAWASFAEPYPLPFDRVPTPRVRRDRALAAAAVIAGVCVGLTPAAVRNFHVSGELHLTTSQLGPNLFIGNNPNAAGSYMPLLPGRGTVATERTDAIELAQREVGRTLTPGEVSRFWVGRVASFIRDEPIAWLTLMGRKVLLLVNAVELADTEDQYTFAHWAWPLRLGYVVDFALCAACACAGCLVLGSSLRRAWVIAAVAGVYAASVVVFYVVARYRLPLAPALMMLAAGGAARWWELGRGVGRHRLIAAGVAMAAGLLLGRAPVASYNEERSNGAFTLGHTLLTRGGDPVAALPYLRSATDGLPAFIEAHKYLGDALLMTGNPAEAIAHLRHAVELEPDYVSAWTALGGAHMANGQPASAAEALRRAVELAPRDVTTRFNLSRALTAARREGEAAAVLRGLIREYPDEPSFLVTTAWLLATSPDDKAFAPAEALELADRAVAVTHGGDDFALHARGLALAALGRFDDAVVAARAARRLAESKQADPALIAELRQREDDYARGKAFRR